MECFGETGWVERGFVCLQTCWSFAVHTCMIHGIPRELLIGLFVPDYYALFKCLDHVNCAMGLGYSCSRKRRENLNSTSS